MNEAKEIGVEVQWRATKPERPVMVYLIAFYFTGIFLFTLASLVYVEVYKISPEARHRMLTLPALLPLAIAECNGFLTIVAAWLLVALRRVAAGLFLASTLLMLALELMSWPALVGLYLRTHSPGVERSLLLGGSNLVLHIGATIYAFHLDRRGLLR